jgi:hypothetical protein
MTLKDLTPAAKAAVESKTIAGGWERRSLVKLLAELERWDNMAEARKSRAKRLFFAGLVGSVLGFILMIIVSSEAGFAYGVWCFLVPLALLFFGLRMQKAAKAIDLPNELRVSLRPVLKLLSQDLHPDEKIKVNLNLAGIDEKKAGRTTNLPPGRNRSLTQSAYDEDLCSLRLPLADGTQAVLRMENAYFKIERRYTTTRGKYKSKTKWKKLSTVSAMLIPPSRISWESGRIASMLDRNTERLTFVEKEGVLAARIDRYYKFKAAGDIPDNAVPGADILRMFVRLTAMRPHAAGGTR